MGCKYQRFQLRYCLPESEQRSRRAKMERMPEDTPTPGFEAGLEELEKIVKEMESGDLPLERALQLFEKGITLSETCRKQLEEAESRVEILIRKGEKVQAEPFQPARNDKP